ncbi:hypothetical protein SLA2020_129420 [Shorea laevis]
MNQITSQRICAHSRYPNLVKIQQLDDRLGQIFTLRSSRSVDQTTQGREKDFSWRCQESGRPERKGLSAFLTRSVIAHPSQAMQLQFCNPYPSDATTSGINSFNCSERVR